MTHIFFSVYRVIFRREPGKFAAKFFVDLAKVALGSGIGMGLSLLFNVFGGRALGPESYGAFTLVVSLGSFIALPMLWGIDTGVIVFGAHERDERARASVVSTGFRLLFLLTCAWGAAFFALSYTYDSAFSISSGALRLAVLFAMVYALYSFSMGSLRAVDRMGWFALMRVAFSLLLTGSFVGFAAWKGFGFNPMVAASYVAYGLGCLWMLVVWLRPHLSAPFHKKTMGKLLSFGAVAMLAGVATILYSNIDKLLVNRYLGISTLGIYRAYWFASVNMTLALFGIFNTVFFPAMVGLRDKRGVLAKLDALLPLAVFVGVPLLVVSQWIILLMYGDQYPFVLSWAFILSMGSIAALVFETQSWLLGSEGRGGMGVNVVVSILLLVQLGAWNTLLIPLTGILGTMLAFLLSMVGSIFLQRVVGRRFLYATS